MTLQATITPPPPHDHPADPFLHNGTSFLRIIGLFRGFDEVLVPLWMKTKTECSDSYLAALEKQVQEILPAYLNDTQAQLAEMQMNQQWLKHKAWELSMANGNGTDAGHPYMATIHELLPMVSYFPGNLGLHGLGLFEHLLNVTYSLTDILAGLPAPRTPFTPRPLDQLRKILNIVTVIRNGEHRFLPLLLSKVHGALPKLASPMLQNAPENAACNNMDIFDGFGNAGMAQPPVYGGDYDGKYGIARLDDMSSDSNSPNGAPSSNDMNSPFASSPGIMSPGGLENIPHSLQTDFTSMPDMVMSPISHAPPSSLGIPRGMNRQQPQHSQHSPMSPFPTSNPHVPNIGQQMHLNQGIGNNGMMARPTPQRANTFAMRPQIHTVGDFQSLQRTPADINMGPLGMDSMGPELGFNSLPTR